MTSTVDTANTNGLLPTKAHDGRTMVGHVVVTPGCDEHAEDAVAVWQVDTGGNSTGAWVYRLDLNEPDPSTAERVLRLCLRRAVVAWRPAETISLLGRFAGVADMAMPEWTHTAITIPDAIEQVATVRTAFEKHTNEMASDRDITPIEWPVDLPDHIPSTVEEMWWATRLELPLSSPVTQAALTTAALVRWTVQRWQETMTALGRRRYLREAFGPQRVLPPAWETRLADAYESHNTT